MELKGSFKRTGIGFFPNEWNVESLGLFWDVIDCKHVTAQFVLTGFPLASIGEVQSRYVDLVNAKQTTWGFYSQLIGGGRKPKAGDLIMSRNATVGEVAQVSEHHPEFAMGQDVCLLRKKHPSLSTDYMQALFRSTIVNRQLADLMVGSTFKRANVQQIRNLTVALPEYAEQEAIAEALSDADALIESLAQLLVKKRQIKQGTLQELLTGKRRLPGFDGEWQLKTLADLFNFSGGYSASRDQLSSNGYCYLHYGDIHTSSKTFIDVHAEYQQIPKFDVALKKIGVTSLLEDGDVVFVDASEDDEGTSKHVVVSNPDKVPFISGLHTIVAKSKTGELAHLYRRYCFQMPEVKAQFLFFAVGTKVSGISKRNIGKITIQVPPVNEQTAIATILCDMDADIAALESRLAKARHIKQGMMQQLLTGKIRLV